MSRGLRVGLLALLTMFGMVAGLTSSASARTSLDRIVAIVGDEIILASELERATLRHPMLQEAIAQLPANADRRILEQRRKDVEATVLDELVDLALLRAEARKFDIRVTDEDVSHAVSEHAQQLGLTVDQLRQQVEQVAEYGSWPEYLEELRDQLMQIKVPSYLITWSVSEAQVRERYRKLTRDESEKVKVIQFLFTPLSSESADRDTAFVAAQTWSHRLRDGTAADESPGGEASVEERTLGRGDIAPALEDAIFAANTNDVVGPLSSGQGYAVFKIVERQESAALSYEDAKERIHAQLENEAFLKARLEHQAQLRAKAHIDIRL